MTFTDDEKERIHLIMATRSIPGPMGPFLIPDEEPRTRDVCLALSRGVWGEGEKLGEYDHPELPTEGVHMILDIGAGWGAFAVWAFKRWPGAGLRCYEPHEAAFKLLLENVENAEGASGKYRSLFQQAAVTTDPDAVLNGCEDWGAYRTHDEKSGVKVRVVHPEALPPADAIKVDCEGCEVEVLTHYKHWDAIKAALIEWHDLDNRAAVHELCGRAGLTLLRDARDMDPEATYGVSVWVRRTT